MSNKQKSTINLQELLVNLQDLNDVSRIISKEMNIKNQIMETGLHDCKVCKSYIDRNNKRKINR